MKIDHQIISMVILPFCWFKKSSCQLLAKNTVKILIIARAFIRIIIFCKEESGHLLKATVFENHHPSPPPPPPFVSPFCCLSIT